MRKIAIFLLMLVLGSLPSVAQDRLTEFPPAFQYLQLLQKATYAPAPQQKTTKTTGFGPVYDPSKWAHRVDSTWGAGIADTSKLTVFNRIWNPIDSAYPCFIHLPMYNWDSLVNDMRTEISAGVSRGRFAGILNRLGWYLNDGHTSIYDQGVNFTFPIYPGLPVMRGQSGLFGACVTMLPDSTALVYESTPGHVLGIEPGDVILGYNDFAWKDIVKVILEHQLPNSVFVGSTDAATWHNLISAAGENWYLFDTINIRKCNGNLVNLPTSLMTGQNYGGRMCSDQLPIPGVAMITYSQYVFQNRSISSGMIAGTRTGYVYMMDCMDISGNSLYNAVKTLVEDSLAESLIFDLRTNYGGSFLAFTKTYEYLSDIPNTPWIGYGERTSLTNRYSLANNLPSYNYDVADTDPASFDGPIAVLCGPGALSAGDFFQVLYKHHPSVKTFGKSTAGAYGAYWPINTGQSGYRASMQIGNFYQVSDPSYYLTHTEFPIDVPIWLDRDSVCAGKDNVVSAALDWINDETTHSPTIEGAQPQVMVYPNPSAGRIQVSVGNLREKEVTIRVYSMPGTVLLEQRRVTDPGPKTTWELGLDDLPNGTYYLTVEGDRSGRAGKKFSLLR